MREDAQVKRRSQAIEFKTKNYLDLDKSSIMDPAQSQNTQVLQPIPAQQTTLKISSYDNVLTKKNINISDFESDTSSPFDNMELKTINDLEELASVLKPAPVFSNTNSKNYQLSDLGNLSISQNYSAPIYNNYTNSYNTHEFMQGANTQTNQPNNSIPTLKSNVFQDTNKTTLPPVTMPNVLLQLKADLNTLKYSDESPVSLVLNGLFIILFNKFIFMFLIYFIL